MAPQGRCLGGRGHLGLRKEGSGATLLLGAGRVGGGVRPSTGGEGLSRMLSWQLGSAGDQGQPPRKAAEAEGGHGLAADLREHGLPGTGVPGKDSASSSQR